ncbi:MAG: SPOR domain-containing protein [Novosphingobium sp.]
MAPSAQGGRGASGGSGFDSGELPLGAGETRLPWLEAGEDDADPAAGSGPLLLIAVVGLLLLGVLAGGLWFALGNHRGPELVADGGIVRAPAGPYKVRPDNPGGGIAAGTGDTSFAVAEGRSRAPAAAAAAATAPASGSAGVGVQIGAFPTAPAAEAAWTRLALRYAPLAGRQHRVIEGRADLGTVFALQALAIDTEAARVLCRELQTAELNCQIRP